MNGCKETEVEVTKLISITIPFDIIMNKYNVILSWFFLFSVVEFLQKLKDSRTLYYILRENVKKS